MRAVVCPKVPIAPSELVYTTTHPTPSPKAGHVLIRVRAFGLNRSELFTRQGHSPGLQFPRILGIECVGEVHDAGGGGSWQKGDIVAAIMGGMGREFDGGYAEYTLVPHAHVSHPIKLPQGMSWAQFAALPETFLTAYGTLHQSLNLDSNDVLFIRGGTTSVGLACAALAKSTLFNSPRVIATTRSENKVAIARACGADDVILDRGSVAEEVKRFTGGKGADKCVELVGGTTIADSCVSLAPEGVISMVGCVSGEWTCREFDPMMCLAPGKHLTMFSSGIIDMSTAPLQWIVDAVARGELKAGVDKVFKIEDAGLAHEYMEANKAAGKVVCVVD
ncbi:GroES-like protein [Rhizopogon vinicolor AM-OR11-026]|uniref:GroES-like protein n=1 Tax=Rhizopogon vinicolor AM-OR11-026 TaxID=1314800 RepID=A0A1B7NE70_9AGAM|nr:GroES-like protein [Rhizopogon vinicolor AM-OR11-026]